MNQGAFDFLLKPIQRADFEATIDKTIKHVAELRRNARSDEENKVLRQFTSAALVERLRAHGPRDRARERGAHGHGGVHRRLPVHARRPGRGRPARP